MKNILLFLLSLCAALSVAQADTYRFAKLGGSGGALIASDVTPTATPFVFGGSFGGGATSYGIGTGLSIVGGFLTLGDVSFDSITDTPTTLAGYGITDAITAAVAASTYQPLIADGSLALAKLAVNPLARGNHTGTQTLSTISDAGTLAGLNAVASANITDGTITNADISASAAIALSKLAVNPLSSPSISESITITTTTIPASNPAAGSFILYVDPSDNTLRARGSSGTITIIANP